MSSPERAAIACEVTPKMRDNTAVICILGILACLLFFFCSSKAHGQEFYRVKKNGVLTITPYLPITVEQNPSFANLQDFFSQQSLIGGCDPSFMFNQSQGGTRHTVDAITGCITIPDGATQYQSNALTGYVINRSATTNGVAGYFFIICNVDNSKCWPVNPAATADANNTTLTSEWDYGIGTGSTGTTITALQIGGIWNGVPGLAEMLVAQVPGGTAGGGATGSARWTAMGTSRDGCCSEAFDAGALFTSTVGHLSQSAQSYVLHAFNSTGTRLTGSYGMDASGNLALQASTSGSVGSVRFLSGIYADGLVKHKRGQAGCATAASVGAVCTTTVTWVTAFADTNYTPYCNGRLVTSGIPGNGGITAQTASSVTFQTVAETAAAAQYTNIDCVGIHD